MNAEREAIRHSANASIIGAINTAIRVCGMHFRFCGKVGYTRSMSAGKIRIALASTFGLAFCRRALRGVKQYAEQKPNWVLLPIDIEPRAVRRVMRYRPSGFVAFVLNRSVADLLVRLRLPVVNI